MRKAFHVHDQASAYASPWSFGMRVKVLLWDLCWTLLCAWTPKPLNAWRLFWLRLFGAKVEGICFVHGHARVIRPWNLTLRNRSCLGDGAVAYCLAPIEIGVGATVAQEAYLCTGSHDFDQAHLPLKTAPIVVGDHSFVGLRAIVMPGVNVGACSVIGAGAVLTRDSEASGIYGGNPAVRIGSCKRGRGSV
jgi:putative colanic acid biosynthesis acetyltransferase WcaF